MIILIFHTELNFKFGLLWKLVKQNFWHFKYPTNITNSIRKVSDFVCHKLDMCNNISHLMNQFIFPYSTKLLILDYMYVGKEIWQWFLWHYTNPSNKTILCWCKIISGRLRIYVFNDQVINISVITVMAKIVSLISYF